MTREKACFFVVVLQAKTVYPGKRLHLNRPMGYICRRKQLLFSEDFMAGFGGHPHNISHYTGLYAFCFDIPLCMSFLQTPAQRWALVIVAFAIFTDVLVYSLIVPMLPKFAEWYQLSQSELGFLYGLYATALLIAAPFAGWITELIGRRRTMIFGLLSLLGATLLFMTARSFRALALARALQGIGASINWTAGMALLSDYFSEEDRGTAFGIVFSGMTFSTLLGPPLGGWLFDLGGMALTFGVVSALVLLDLLGRILLLQEPVLEHIPLKDMQFRNLIKPHMLLLAVLLVGGVGLISSLEPTLPLYLSTQFHSSPTQIGLYFGLFAVASALGYPIGAWLGDRYGRMRVVGLALLLTTPLFILIPVYPALGYFLMLLCLTGFVADIFLGPLMTEITVVATQYRIGSAITAAMINILYSLGYLMPVLTSYLVEKYQLVTGFALYAALVWVLVGALWHRAGLQVQ